MSPIKLWSKIMARLERLRRFAKGDNRDFAPISPIVFQWRFRVRLERLRRFAKGDNRVYAPVFLI